ncbi:MAG TPA: hypothetical protein VFA21_20480 [Pyrinomonadaceae bacterium]|jgi:hypothetical protein|nr:hypothetical protein [Pyrinomonadaceae bacterium]
MPHRYSTEAIEHCLSLYLRFNGQSHDLIEAEMRKTWPGWSRQNLCTRGKGKNLKLGWIERYGWEEALRQKIASSGRRASTSAEALYNEIEQVRQRIKAQLDAVGSVDRDLVYQHRDYCKLSIDAMARLEAARDNLVGFVAFWENLLEWLPAISMQAAHELLTVSEKVIERARAEYADGQTKG